MQDFLFTLNITTEQARKIIASTPIQDYLRNNVLVPIYTLYAPHCHNTANLSVCTNKELSYLQWINGTVLLNPPASLGIKPTNESYVRAFPDWTSLTFTPELGYFLAQARLPPFPLTTRQVVTFMQPNRLYNQEIIGDILLNLTKPTYSPVFTNHQMARYLKFVAFECGLNGLFLYKTPRDYIEGFRDSLLGQMSQVPVYMGGDQTTDPFMALNQSPTSPANNPMAFFTGTDDFMFTRRMGLWLNQEYISLKRMDYDSIS